MKKFIILCLILAATTVNAGGSLETASGTPVQGFAPNGLYSALLTVNSVTYNLLNTFTAFSVYCPADAKMRLMTSTDKTGSISETIPGGSYHTLVVNRNTPFVNISGCTSGILRRM